MNKSKLLLPLKTKGYRATPFHKISYLKEVGIDKKSKAAVVVDNNDVPRFFIFDTFALLDLLSQIDDALVDRLSPEDYHSKGVNPSGWLIDEIESRLPLKKNFVLSLKKALKQGQKEGWIPFSQIKFDLDLE